MKPFCSKSRAAWMGTLALTVALLGLAVAGCASDTDTTQTTGQDTSGPTTPATTETAAADADLALTEADNGKSFDVSVGDTIIVVLAGNPTTGYQWASDLSEEAAAVLTLVGEPEYVADPVAGGVVGSGGKYTLTFTVAAVGRAELALKYWRSFEPDAEPEQTFSATMTVNVK